MGRSMPEGELPTRLRRSDEFFMTHSRIGTLRTTPLRDHGPAGRYPLNSLMSPYFTDLCSGTSGILSNHSVFPG
jgi:hypothetical protein